MGSLADLLTEWLPRQRWFAAKGVDLHAVSLAAQSRLAQDLDGAAVDHVLIEVASPLGTQYYQVFLGWRDVAPASSQQWVVGELDGLVAYDALHDPAVIAELLRRAATGEQWGDITLRPEPGARIDPNVDGRVLSGEQSNTSVIYDGPDFGGILKVYRRLEPGTNPDVEVHRALHAAGSFHVARPLAVVASDVHGVPTTLGFLSSFFANAADGWEMATATVRRLMDADGAAADGAADFTAEAHRLGRAVAEIHRDLGESFGRQQLSDDAWIGVVDGMVAEAERVAGHVPAVAERLDRIRTTFDRARSVSTAVVVQRVHGDLHLGQTLRTPTGWAVIDFEGEPAKSLEERKRQQLPAKDVAGMLRSFDYAANHLRPASATTAAQLTAAQAWAHANRQAFLTGYADVADGPDLDAPEVITAFELDKAVYEVAYEHGNRPDWEAIPLAAVDTLIEADDETIEQGPEFGEDRSP